MDSPANAFPEIESDSSGGSGPYRGPLPPTFGVVTVEEPAAPGPPPAPPPRPEEPAWEPPGDQPFWRWAGERLAALPTPGIVILFVDVVAVGLACLFVFSQLHPDLIFTANTPTGGDMGAHVLGPAYLRDHLLPEGRITGWSPDWYAGFPLYHFYMVVPALAIVALNVGLRDWAAFLPLVAAIGLGVLAGRVPSQRRRRWLVALAITVGVVGIGLPYGVAFKVIAALGPVTLPLACYVFGRLARLPFPAPALMAGSALLFLVNTEPNANDGNTGNIIGGNLTSTMAGEYSFTVSLTLMVLYFGLLLRGLHTGRHRAGAAVVLALCGLCHLIPAIYAAGGTVIALLVGPPTGRRLKWMATTATVAAMLAAFWVLPFVLRRRYLNDMGWEKLPTEGSEDTISDFLTPSSLRWVMFLAAVGVVMSIAWRYRAGLMLFGMAVVAGAAFVYMPEYRLWNARILPMWYLALFLLAAIGLAEMGRAAAVLVARDPDRPLISVRAVTGGVGFACALVIAGVHLGSFPGGTATASGGYRVAAFGVAAEDRSSARSWAEWNFSGYEAKDAYPEYYGLIRMMQRVAADPEQGCGRSLWEYGQHIGQYGTPMAPMLLPYWTDGCIESMEGLFFESSATTPYHFLSQSALSASGSRAQRDLPYPGFDLDLGVQQLHLLGVRYYIAFEEATVTAAAEHPDLEEIDRAEPWHVYRVRDSELVVPLASQPAVLTDADAPEDWLDTAASWYQDPSRWDVFLAADGPAAWDRVSRGSTPRPEAVADVDVDVSNVELGRDALGFDVSATGTPVLVKVSYFPNWQVDGAEGPFRVSPNFMVVIPTDTHVELRYGSTPVDVAAYLLTLLGIGAAVWLARRPPSPIPPNPRSVAHASRSPGRTRDKTGVFEPADVLEPPDSS
ncbi:MAG: hypothetical protein ACRD29_19295 [Acidimicrobiales bacterium]